MTHGNGGQQRPPRVPDAIGTRDGGDAFAAVFDGEAPGTIEPYVRLVPPPADGPPRASPPTRTSPSQADPVARYSTQQMSNIGNTDCWHGP